MKENEKMFYLYEFSPRDPFAHTMFNGFIYLSRVGKFRHCRTIHVSLVISYPSTYRANGPIRTRVRNREFLIWAKGEGGVSPAEPLFLRNVRQLEAVAQY